MEDKILEQLRKRKEKLKEYEEKEKKNKQNNFKDEFDVTFAKTGWLGLYENDPKIFRIIGLPVEYREKPIDPKIVWESKILGDNGKFFKVRWRGRKFEQNEELVENIDPEFILYKMANHVLNSIRWENRKPNFIYEHTDSFKRMHKTGNKPANYTFDTQFLPAKRVVMNVIDRMDDWCEMNKKTKLISDKEFIKEYDDTDEEGNKRIICYRNTGLHYRIYDLIIDSFLTTSGNWETDDICCLRHYSYNDKGKSKWEYDKIFTLKHNPEAEKYFTKELYELMKKNSGELTDTEKKYELVNLDTSFAPTKYSLIKKRLEGLFSLVDGELKTTFLNQLNMLVDKENESNPYNNNESKEDNNNDNENNTRMRKEKESINVPEKSKQESNLSTIENLCKENFDNYEKLQNDEKGKLVNSIEKFEGTIPIWKKESEPYVCTNKDCVYKGTKERTLYTNKILTCPVCGTVDQN